MVSSSIATTNLEWHVKPNDNSHCPLNTTCYTLSQLLQQYSQKVLHPTSTALQLYFQTGVYILSYDDEKYPALFTNLYKIQLKGQASNGIPVIKCYQRYSLTFRNITTTIINDISFEDCGGVSKLNRQRSATLHFVGSHTTLIHNITITPSANSSGIVMVNCQGKFNLTNFTIVMEHCNNEKHMIIQYGVLINHTQNINSAHYSIQYYVIQDNTKCHYFAVGIGHLQRNGNVFIIITQLHISHVINPLVLYYYSNACSSSSNNQLIITKSTFNNNKELESTMFNITFEDCWLKESYKSQQSIIQISHCQIANNTFTLKPRTVISITSKYSVFVKSQLSISDCNFTNNKNMLILKVKSETDLTWLYSNLISITNTRISGINNNNRKKSLIFAQHTLLLTYNLTVKSIKEGNSIFQLKNNSIIQMRSQNVLADNSLKYLVRLSLGSYICLLEHSNFQIENNNIYSMFLHDVPHESKTHPCIIQLISDKGGLYQELIKDHLYKITIRNNKEKHSMFPGRELFNISSCNVIPDTLKQRENYVLLARDYFVVEENTDNKERDICNCDKDGHPLCERDRLLVATYPGKTVTTKFVVQKENDTGTITLLVDTLKSNCSVLGDNERLQSQPNNCSKFHYTLSSLDNSTCSLYLKETEILDATDKFLVKLEPCPLGFSLNTKDRICKCDQILMQYSVPITSCDINNQMITRQANSWVSGEVRNKYQLSNYIYTYKTSSSCPFDFCQHYSSKLWLNESDLQCQYNRTGLVCAHCPSNLSAIFGSSRCQRCSNLYLLIIIPIAIVGIALVLLMFTLNFTVVNGSIATFILYINIISINKTLLFQTTSTDPLYVIIAMANLDLGMELCFYDGMDDYAKMWLQLVFPFYLMLIAVILIIASRYSSKVQRVTAQRGLPVLATLFLLSYTKILSTTCIVLFSYNRVVTLSRNATNSILDHGVEFVWAVSSNVELFKVKHSMLFIVNILLLLILIPFNVILLFNRKLSRFKIIQKFKPILDPYKAPYKDRFYYWTGYQLVIRMAYLSAGGLSRNNNLTTAMIITGFVMCIHGYLHPFKHKLLNLQELIMLFNILIIYVSTNFEQQYYNIPIRAAIGSAVAYFTVLLVWHLITQTCGQFILKNLPQKLTKWKEKLISSGHELNEMQAQENSWVIGTYEEYREPLVAVTD